MERIGVLAQRLGGSKKQEGGGGAGSFLLLSCPPMLPIICSQKGKKAPLRGKTTEMLARGNGGSFIVERGRGGGVIFPYQVSQ